MSALSESPKVAVTSPNLDSGSTAVRSHAKAVTHYSAALCALTSPPRGTATATAGLVTGHRSGPDPGGQSAAEAQPGLHGSDALTAYHRLQAEQASIDGDTTYAPSRHVHERWPLGAAFWGRS